MLLALITLAFIHFCALITPGPDFSLYLKLPLAGLVKTLCWSLLV